MRSSYSIAVIGAVFFSACKPSAQCWPADPSVICDDGYSCNPSTRHCEKKCADDKSCKDNEPGQICIGGWCRSCADKGLAVNESEFEDFRATCECEKNAECSSGFCDRYGFLSASPGRCVPQYTRHKLVRSPSDSTIERLERSDFILNILYVDNQKCSDNPTGSMSRPFCEIYQAIQKNRDDSFAHPILVRPSMIPYSGRYWTVSGKYLPSPLWVVGSEQYKTVSISAPIELAPDVDMNLALDGIWIRNDSQSKDAIMCVAADSLTAVVLHLRRCLIQPSEVSAQSSSGAAISINGCSMELDRSAVLSSPGNGIDINNGSLPNRFYQITNSIIALNRLDPNLMRLIKLSGAGIFRYNTVFRNGPKSKDGAVGVTCENSANKFVDSIISDNWPRADGSQFLSACAFNGVYIGSDAKADKYGDPFGEPSPQFTNADGGSPTDFKLNNPAGKYIRARTLGDQKMNPRFPSINFTWDYSGDERGKSTTAIGAFKE
jgi:hypothetical protein